MLKENPANGIVLCNPKFPANVGAVIRAASSFCVPKLYITGNRYRGSEREPREFRMSLYKDVEIITDKYCLRSMKSVVPIAVEIMEGSENIIHFTHPENAVYVFGPEDGSLDRSELIHCHKFITVPGKHCYNLASTVHMVLYDRMLKNQHLLI